jgi:uncharacterized protein YjiK
MMISLNRFVILVLKKFWGPIISVVVVNEVRSLEVSPQKEIKLPSRHNAVLSDEDIMLQLLSNKHEIVEKIRNLHTNKGTK